VVVQGDATTLRGERQPWRAYGSPMADDAPSPMGALIRSYRADRGMTQTALARAAEISKTYLSELEGGQGTRPSADVLLRLADALGVSIADLLGRSVVATSSQELPPGLLEFAQAEGLPDGDVRMLASIHFRGDPPKTARRWQIIYDTIRMSATLEDRG